MEITPTTQKLTTHAVGGSTAWIQSPINTDKNYKALVTDGRWNQVGDIRKEYKKLVDELIESVKKLEGYEPGTKKRELTFNLDGSWLSGIDNDQITNYKIKFTSTSEEQEKKWKEIIDEFNAKESIIKDKYDSLL